MAASDKKSTLEGRLDSGRAELSRVGDDFRGATS